MINNVSFTSLKRNRVKNNPQKKKPANNNKKKVAAAIGMLAAGSAMGVLIAAHIRRPKIQNIQETAKNTQKALTDTVKNIQFIKGRAFTDTQEPFEGVIKTVNKKGDEIAIEFKNGNMINSHKNGKLFKTYETNKMHNLYADEPGESTYTVLKNIKQYDNEGNIVKENFHNYGEGDKLKRVLTFDFKNKSAYAKDFTPEGKVSVYSKYLSPEYPWLTKQLQYDKGGVNLIKEIKVTERGPYKITDYRKGTEKYYHVPNPFTTGADETSVIEMFPLKGWGPKKPLGKKISEKFHSIFNK